MDSTFIAKPLTLYFQEATQDFLPNKKLFFRFRKNHKKYSHYSIRFEGSFKTPNQENKTLLLSKDFRFQQHLILSDLLTLSTIYQPYQSNGIELGIISKMAPFKLSASIQSLNSLSHKSELSQAALSYKMNPHRLRVSYAKMQSPFHELELSYLISPKVAICQNLDLGCSFTLSEKKSFDLNYYEFFFRGIRKQYQLLGALTSNKSAKGPNRLRPGNLTLALRKRSSDTVFNLILEHNLHDKRSLLTAIYESSIEDAIILKNYVNSEYQVSSSMVYKVNPFLKIVHSSSINIKRFFNQGEKYKLGLGVCIEI